MLNGVRKKRLWVYLMSPYTIVIKCKMWKEKARRICAHEMIMLSRGEFINYCRPPRNSEIMCGGKISFLSHHLEPCSLITSASYLPYCRYSQRFNAVFFDEFYETFKSLFCRISFTLRWWKSTCYLSGYNYSVQQGMEKNLLIMNLNYQKMRGNVDPLNF